jgi:multiple sugar transport system substrate-binding protein
MRRRLALVATALTAAVGLAACTDDAAPEPSAEQSSSAPADQEGPVTVGVYGPPEVQDAWRSVVNSFNGTSDTEVTLRTWPSHHEAIRDVVAGDAPDVFMTSRRDLGKLAEEDLTRAVGLPLDERGVDFGDRFSRDALDAFAVEDNLQCMPYSVSPMVMYYNRDLVDFEKMQRRGLDVPTTPERWSMAEFTAAAQFASRRGRATGVHIDPTLEGLAPFIHSGGGQVFDDAEDPTSLDFSDEDTREALEQTLAVLRDPTLTLTERQLQKGTPLQWFKRGELAMIAGFRDLVPELRAEPRLSFDVISMPVLDSTTTVGEIDALCISADTDNPNDSADFLAHAVSDDQMARVTRTGYVVPANTSVAASDVFLAAGRQPENAVVFNDAIRGMQIPPLFDEMAALEAAVQPMLEDLLTQPGVLDLEVAGEEIDRASQRVLAPEETEETDETEEPQPSESESSSDGG